MTLRFTGCENFRQRILLASLSGRPIRIDDIRSDDPLSPGLRDFEASFLRLIEKVTNGCEVAINETGEDVNIIGYYFDKAAPIAACHCMHAAMGCPLGCCPLYVLRAFCGV
jgi:hypothetical protein